MRTPSLLFVILLASCPPLAAAQAPAPTAPAAPAAQGSAPQASPVIDPREMSDAARKAYARGLKDARTLLAEKRYAEAIVVLDGLSAQRPREPQARFLKGVALADSGKTDEAIVVYAGLLSDFPELPEVRNNLAVLYAQKGNYEGARDELVAAIAAAPDYAIAYENLGDVYTRLAGTQYEKAIARDAKNKTAPPKLKLVREVLGMRPPPAPAAAAPITAPAATAEPPPAAEAPK